MQHQCRAAVLCIAAIAGIIYNVDSVVVETATAADHDRPPDKEDDLHASIDGKTVEDALVKVDKITDKPEDIQKSPKGSMLLELAAEGKLYKQEHQHWELKPSRGSPQSHRLHHLAQKLQKPAPSQHKMGINEELLEGQYRVKRDRLEKKLAKVAKQVENRLAQCMRDPQNQPCEENKTDSCRWPEPKKFDLLISWWTDKNQSTIKSNVKPGAAPSLLQQSLASGFENQAEIKYALRSFEKHGLLDHVNNIYLLIAQETLRKYGAPRSFNYSNKALRIITETDMGAIGMYGDNKWRKFLSLDGIPGLSDYALWLPDDNFMVKPFNMDYLYDSSEGKPFLYSYGSFSLGWCDGMPAVGATHGPVFINKCAYRAVADNYWRLMRSGGLTSKKPIDAPCLFTNAMRSQWKWKAQNELFHRECHTNAIGGCNPFSPDRKPLFLNVQGNGISDEYAATSNTEAWGEKKLMPHGPARWFHDEFPTKSRFEI